MFYFIINKILTFIKISLSSHLIVVSTSPTSNRSFAVGSTGSWSSTIWSRTRIVTKSIKIVEHKIHIFLFVFLKMMNNPLVFMNLNSDVRISLPRNSSWFYKIGWLILIQIITTLHCRNFLHRLNIYLLMLLLMHLLSRSAIYRFLSTTHWFIIELSTLFLKLIITNVKGISAHTMITHPHLILLIEVLL